MISNLIHSLLESSALKFPEKVGLIENGHEFSYREINEASQRICSFVSSISKFQDRVILLLPNSFEYIASYFGILKSGRIAVPIDPAINAKTLREKILTSEANLCLTNKILKTKYSKVTRNLILENSNQIIENPLRNFRGARPHIKPDHIASLLFTTGTTGASKGVIVKHTNAYSAVENILKILKYSTKSIDANALPLTHSFGLGNVHSVFATGGTVLLYKNFINLKKILEDITEHKATSFSATPPIFETLAWQMDSMFKKNNRSLELMLSNSAPIPPRTIKKILKLSPNTDFFTYYGLTEASRSTFINYRKEPFYDSVGKSAPRVTISVLSENGKKLPAFEIGEINIKGPTVVQGYWKNELETQKRIKNQFLASGDYGYKDKKGYIYLVGRKDEIINIGGNKVYPYEIEQVLKKHKSIEDVAVVCIKDDILGEVPRAVIVSIHGVSQDVLREDIKKFCRKHLEPFKIPKIIDFVERLPKTSSGKLQKKLII